MTHLPSALHTLLFSIAGLCQTNRPNITPIQLACTLLEVALDLVTKSKPLSIADQVGIAEIFAQAYAETLCLLPSAERHRIDICVAQLIDMEPSP